MSVLAIAAVAVREVLSRKLQVNLLLFGLLLVVSSFVASELTVGEQHRIIADLGLSAIGLVGTLMATFLGAGLISGEVDRRVIYAVLAKPVSRSGYLLGRYLGLAVALVMNLLAMGALLGALLAAGAPSIAAFGEPFAAAVVMLCVKTLVVAAVAVLFSAFSTTTLSAIFTLTIAVAGHLTGDMRALWRGGAEWLPKVIWYALPNLGALTLNEPVIYRSHVGWSALTPGLYALCYAAAALALAAAVFERRDLK